MTQKKKQKKAKNETKTNRGTQIEKHMRNKSTRKTINMAEHNTYSL